MKMDSNDPLRVNVEQILESGDRAASLTQNLLAFSRKQIMNPRPVSLNEIMMKVEKFLLRIIGEDIELRTKFGGGRLIVNVDFSQIEQTMINLATNARDAMPRGGVLSIETGFTVIDNEFIRAHGFGEPGNYAFISATDTGTGMDKETRDKIFEPFFTTKEVGKGTGLGLAMVYGIVKQHNGYIMVYSEPGEGTTFKIYIPVVAVKAEGKKEAPIPTVPAGGTETILVAEDDPALRKLDETILTEFGYHVITAEDGEDAINKFMENKDKINICILDMIMPKKSGEEACMAIRQIRPDIKVFFASGYASDKTHMDKLLREGFDFIQKPVPPNDLLKKIREVLDK
jgi:CheY-like chemotaxis protein